MRASPFARFNLFRNPFGELTVAERAELAVVEVDRYLSWIEHSSHAAIQVIGPCGHGKSTHLRALQYAWAARHASGCLPAFVYFPEEGDQPALPRSRPLFIDEAQRMRWWRRRQLLARPGPVVIGTHRDMSRGLTAAGFQVQTIDLDQPIATQRLQELLNRRIWASSTVTAREGVLEGRSAIENAALRRVCLGETDLRETDLLAPDLILTIAQVVALQERFGSNVRQIEEYLYERFQSLALKGGPWLPVE